MAGREKEEEEAGQTSLLEHGLFQLLSICEVGYDDGGGGDDGFHPETNKQLKKNLVTQLIID